MRRVPRSGGPPHGVSGPADARTGADGAAAALPLTAVIASQAVMLRDLGTSTALVALGLAALACGGGSMTSATGSSSTTTLGGTESGGTGTDGSGSESDSGGGMYDDEEEIVLRINDAPVPPLSLQLNREQVSELFGDTAKDILLVEVDSTPLLTNALTEITYACGDKWKLDSADPQHDCSLTPLGQTFKGPDSTWKTSAEYSLVRLLTMTPANSEVAGTSIAGMQELADLLKIGGGFAQILSESLGLPRTTPFVPTDMLTQAIQTDLLATHPAIGGDGKTLPISLYDALTDLASLGDKFGPAGDHPGLLDPDFQTKSVVLSPEFSMNMSAESNLRLLDGADLSKANGNLKGYMSTVVDVTPPTFDDELEFDFNDPNKFAIEGVVEDPTVDMRFAVYEHPSFVSSCVGDDKCKKNLPDMQIAAGSAWSIDPWLAEHLIVRAAHLRYGDRIFDKCYELLFICSAQVTIGPAGDYPNNPPGWSVFDVFLNLGNPPKDQFVWELLTEVAQVALHTPPYGDIPEGKADVAFTLSQIPIGVSGSAIAEAARPFLQDQAAKLSDLILGDYWKNNDAVDFYYRRGADNVPYLFFVTQDDLPPGASYGYANPGFFSCPALTEDCRVSALELGGAGDTTHEKVAVPAGETLFYVQDDQGGTYRLRVIATEAGAAEITVRVSKKTG